MNASSPRKTELNKTIQNKTWLMVADISGAKIFSVRKNGSLTILKKFEDIENRKHIADTTSDLPGRTFNRLSDGKRHAMEAKHTPKEHGASTFAKSICKELDSYRESGEFNNLVVAAAPSFLGILRKNMSPGTSSLVSSEIDKDLTWMSTEEIMKHLPNRL